MVKNSKKTDTVAIFSTKQYRIVLYCPIDNHRENCDNVAMRYPGAKKQHMQMLINHIPRHNVYIEPFLGSGELFFKKKTAEKNIGIDIDENIIKNFGNDSVSGKNTFICQDACKFLSQYHFQGGEFLFVDPPYLHSTRSQKKIYRHEIGYEYHLRLLNILTNLDVPIMLAGYMSPLYENLLSGWRHMILKRKTADNGHAVEMIWMNYQDSCELHDYSHIGSDFRQREEFSRRQISMREKYKKLTMVEKNAFHDWVVNKEDKHVY